MHDVIHISTITDPTTSLDEISIPCSKLVGKTSDPIGSRTIHYAGSEQDDFNATVFSKLQSGAIRRELWHCCIPRIECR